jgi:acyl dehydratase
MVSHFGHDQDGERSRYHGPNPTRALAPLCGLLLVIGFTVRATGHDPISLAGDTARWIASAPGGHPISRFPDEEIRDRP